MGAWVRSFRFDGGDCRPNLDGLCTTALVLIAADCRAISERPNMLVKQNLLLISNRHSMRMGFRWVLICGTLFEFMQVNEAASKVDLWAR